MQSLRISALLLVAMAGFPAWAEDGTKVTLNEFTCELPFGWHQVENPKAVLEAMPSINDGRLFGVVVEPSRACPVPCEIENESDFEKGFWGRYDKTFEAHSHAQITSREFRVIHGVPFRVLHAVRENIPGTSAKFYLVTLSTPGNGKLYGILTREKGVSPDNDKDLQKMVQSFTFLTPPRLAWYQPLLHYFSEIIGAPLFLLS